MAQQHLSQPKAIAHDADNQQKPIKPSSPVVNPSVPTPCSQAEPCYIEEKTPEKPLPRFIRPEWVIVYITAVYGVITLRMLWTINRQANLMEDTAKRQLRAYMCVTDGILEIHPDGRVKPRFTMLNCGQTPAYDLIAIKRFMVAEWGQRESLPALETTPSASKGILAPQNRRPIRFRESTLSQEVMSALQAGKMILVIHGFITYRDIFGEWYRLEFQMLHGGADGWKFPDCHIGSWRTRFRMDSTGNREYQTQQPDSQTSSAQNPN